MDKRKYIKRINEDNHVVATLYKLGLLILLPLVAAFFYLRTDVALSKLITGGYSCAYRRATGMFCPGCGGTRAAIYLARFHIINSIKMNAAVPLGAFFYILFMIIETLHYGFDIKGFKEKHVYIMIGIFVAAIVARFIIVNVLLLAT